MIERFTYMPRLKRPPIGLAAALSAGSLPIAAIFEEGEIHNGRARVSGARPALRAEPRKLNPISGMAIRSSELISRLTGVIQFDRRSPRRLTGLSDRWQSARSG